MDAVRKGACYRAVLLGADAREAMTNAGGVLGNASSKVDVGKLRDEVFKKCLMHSRNAVVERLLNPLMYTKGGGVLNPGIFKDMTTNLLQTEKKLAKKKEPTLQSRQATQLEYGHECTVQHSERG